MRPVVRRSGSWRFHRKLGRVARQRFIGVREHLTEAEIEKLLTALRQNRYGHRDWLVGLMIYRHGLRVVRSLRSPLG